MEEQIRKGDKIFCAIIALQPTKTHVQSAFVYMKKNSEQLQKKLKTNNPISTHHKELTNIQTKLDITKK